ncbi:extracellular solute-binding protein [Streptomyces sp. LHD-70]|uniref:extracellular solute-binding protein n=1 Tax=Streptomyces sp. LHD-70 TaxID=3072140 RepID=UPI00280F7DAB|nr:extracellular solute-binding protein [Streptomyces sp. LHD-70]MDQ8705297.1 extracellular solute-binding protein [Streptomyces sp. LHD-70]
MSRRTLLAAGAAGAAAASLTGCAATADTGPDLAAAAVVPKGPATVRWWAARVARKDGGDLRPLLVREFNKKYPHITVRMIGAPAQTDTARAALATQIASGSPSPDVFMGDSVWPAQFAYNSMALPLRSLVGEDYWRRYPGPHVEALSYEGEVYAFPLYQDQPYLFYRKDLLRKHGLPVPRHWEELADSAAKVQRAGDADYGFVWQGSVYEGLTCNITELVADAGGSILTEDGKGITFDGPAGERALTYLRDLVARGITPKSVTTFIEQDSLDAFTSGRSVFLRNWSYAWGVANNPESSAVAGKIGCVVRPGFEGERGGQGCLGGWCNYVNPHSRNLGAAVAFARFLSDEGGQMVLAREAAVLPPLDEALQSRHVRDSDNPAFSEAHRVRLVARPVHSPHYPAVSKAVYTRANQVISGGSSVRTALASARRDLRAALKGEAL